MSGLDCGQTEADWDCAARLLGCEEALSQQLANRDSDTARRPD